MAKRNYHGVKLNFRADRFVAEIKVNGQLIYGVSRKVETEAAKDYDFLCIKYGKEPKNGFYKSLKP